MSPEQASGKPVDKRTDIWAFGACLYEALSGRRAFDGDDAALILGSVLRLEPDWTALPAKTTPAVRTLLRRCLSKDPRERLHDIADARLELREAADQLRNTDARIDRAGGWRESSFRLPIAVGTAAAAVLFQDNFGRCVQIAGIAFVGIDVNFELRFLIGWGQF